MSKIGDSERTTQNSVVKFFVNKLHYTYLGNLHDSENKNIMQDSLSAYLARRGYSEKLIERAIDKLVKVSSNLEQGLYFANKEVYSLLKYGAKVKEEAGESPKTVQFIVELLAFIFYKNIRFISFIGKFGKTIRRPFKIILFRR